MDPSSLNAAATAVFTDTRQYPGHLIAMCGFDGSGKTTQINALAQHFTALGHEVLQTRQPTGAYRAEAVVREFLDHGGDRDRANTLAVMAAADRLKHVHTVLRPALAQGKIVLCDRYIFSSLVFFQARGVAPDFVARMNAGIPEPTLSVFLDVPVERLLQRLTDRDGPVRKHEERNKTVVSKIVERFRSLDAHLATVDGTQDAADVTSSVLELFDAARANRVDGRTIARTTSERSA